MKKRFDRNRLDIILAVILFFAIGLCVYSCKKCNSTLSALHKQQEYQTPNILID